ncbi:glucose-1-phosphate thymidylyltransferase RfbA [Evansella sp. AB-rgal1]|uniref:glucose-1-phosphate thymidylyltransferase RfbA n=1 Tax=Evansella sp. AB-rgal1 TaxID=3242696 RepID=UPI00359E842B
MKGILLAGGHGTRLFPLTNIISKHLLPIYDKPMVYYPLSILMLAGIKEVLIITTMRDLPSYKGLFGDGSHLGITISYEVQDQPNGIAEAFLVGKEFIGDDSVGLILGDNIFYGQGLVEILRSATQRSEGATVFGYRVKDPHRFGVAEFDEDYKVISIEEKPQNPRSNVAVTGLYFYDNKVVSIAESISPSDRGELEITDINKAYLSMDQLHIEPLGRGFAWLDTGTHNSLVDASRFIETIENRQGLKVACIEEIAYRMSYISAGQLKELAKRYKNDYGEYLMSIAEQDGEDFFTVKKQNLHKTVERIIG